MSAIRWIRPSITVMRDQGIADPNGVQTNCSGEAIVACHSDRGAGKTLRSGRGDSGYMVGGMAGPSHAQPFSRQGMTLGIAQA